MNVGATGIHIGIQGDDDQAERLPSCISRWSRLSSETASTAHRVVRLFEALTLTVAGGYLLYWTANNCATLPNVCVLELFGAAVLTVSGLLLSGKLATELCHPLA